MKRKMRDKRRQQRKNSPTHLFTHTHTHTYTHRHRRREVPQAGCAGGHLGDGGGVAEVHGLLWDCQVDRQGLCRWGGRCGGQGGFLCVCVCVSVCVFMYVLGEDLRACVIFFSCYLLHSSIWTFPSLILTHTHTHTHTYFLLQEMTFALSK